MLAEVVERRGPDRCATGRGCAARGGRHRRPGAAAADVLRKHGQAWRAARAAAGRHGLFAGKVGVFQRQAPAHPPGLPAARRRRDDDPDDADDSAADAAAAFAGALIPVYPATRQLPSWQIAKARRRRCSTRWASCRDPLPADVLRASIGLPVAGARRSGSSTARPTDERLARARWTGSCSTRRSSCRSRWPSAGPRPRALPAVPRGPRRGGRARRVRRAAAVRADRRASARSAARSPPTWPATHPMHRLLQGEVGSRQDGRRAARDARGRRRRRAGGAARARPRCSPSSTTARCATLLGPLAERGMLGGADVGTRVALLTGSQARPPRRRGAARRRPAARPASSSAPTRCSRRRCSSPTSAWSSSTSSTASASSSATRCAAKGATRRRTCWS